MTTVDPSEKTYEVDPLVTRVLKRGDLTRLNSNKPGKLMDHHGDLARVVKATPVSPSLENSHPFVYDLELVLGGKLHGVFRVDLLYTTASQEGMTDDSRQRRKRTQSSHYDDAEEEAKKAKSKAGRKKKAPAGKKGKAATVTTPKSTTVVKKRPAGDKGKGPASSNKKSKPNPAEDTAVSSTALATQAMDLFERHRREFERSIGRLEKADAYNFFGTAVPPEFQETYTKSNPETSDKAAQQPSNDSSSDPVLAQHFGTISQSQSPYVEGNNSQKKSKKKKKGEDENDDDDDTIVFPSTPPFNFVVIRQRMEHGRYIIDRVRLENEERIELLTPYWKSIGRKNIIRRPKRSLIPVLHPKGIDWDLFRKDIHAMCDSAVERNQDLDDVGPGTLAHAASKIKDLMEHIYEKNGRRHFIEMAAANDRHRFSLAMDQKKNTEAAMQGKWKRDAFPERKYERLKGDVVCAGLSELDQKIAAYELKTSLEDKFIGLAYKYDDTGQSEGWMKSVLDVTTGEQSQRQKAAMALASDEGAIKAQVNACMQSLLIGVLDKVMTEKGVLQQKELLCANSEEVTGDVLNENHPSQNSTSKPGPDFVVQEVWGIDCYTRRNVTICLETEFDSDTVQTFTEKWLLPAINACPVDLAYDLSNACRMLEGLPFDVATSLEGDKGTTYEAWKNTLLGQALLNKISTFGPPWLKAIAHLLRRARDNLGPDFFRIHPKGHGSIVLCEKLEPNRLVTFYRGEVYPSWRWGEKIDAIAKIQKEKGLKPVLPDFFNMALERPQHDPRGYGLLFVDASRKSNYGSMLSHSCQPSCEVHVVAVNGELRLAITTIREMSIGDELTFDYNAVTESLFEYQSAVCLCGHSRCSGSFLHFAAADCYQQVLNRNSPVASRVANLIKGCTKKVMSEEDDRILKRHGFQTAAFGAVSVNRRNASALDKLDSSLDSMSIVPVWLRTFVADTLRYIEYERRALPIALICNDIYDETGSAPAPVDGGDSNDDESSGEDEDQSGEDEPPDETEKPAKRSKPEPTFFFYARTQREYFLSLLSDDEDKKTLTGAELKREVQKLASVHWKSLDAEAKEEWKVKAHEDWEKNAGGKVGLDDDKKKRRPKSGKNGKSNSGKRSGDEVSLKKPKISFQEADAEGVSAMEQRIQQLTQTLSRVGRVLDRHREAALRLNFDSSQAISDESLREITHSPIVIMPDEHVVAWMWNHPDGIVRTLLKYAEIDPCVSPELHQSILDTVEKHSVLEQFGTPWATTETVVPTFPISPSEARERLNEALLALRKDLLDGIQQMATLIKKQKSKFRVTARRKEREEEQARANGSAEKISIRLTLKVIMNEMISTIENRVNGSMDVPADDATDHDTGNGANTEVPDADLDLDPWLRNFNKRFKLEKAADLLLFYAKTGYFFSIKAYQPLKSSPIEVYARELGNAVPASTVDRELVKEPDSTLSSPLQSPSHDGDNESTDDAPLEDSEIGASSSKKSRKLCNPEDIISNVVVEYQGDYVLSQLLQWYNAGIGQKPGLPDVVGCVLLPLMKGCWTVDGTTVSNSHTDRATRYQSTIRRRLIEWLKDPLKRGNPWPDEVRRAFLDKEEEAMISDSTSKWLPLGSPILDFLVTGDDHNMNAVTAVLSRFHSSAARSGTSTGEGLLSSVDEGRPAEAVSNWVQCENPDCQKWRKVPWHVDIDMLPEQFYCKENVWNPKSASCDAPEDEWDQTTDAQVGVDGSALLLDSALDTTKKRSSESTPSFKLCDFREGALFDIRREGKKSWAVGTVIKTDLAGDVKRIKIHYPNMSFKHDEWIDVDSPRISPPYSRVQRPSRKENADNGNQNRGSKSSKAKSREKKTNKKKKSSGKGGDAVGRSNIISDDASIEQTDKLHVVHTDDSSMADVFTQDSDDDDDMPAPKSRRVRLEDSDDEDNFAGSADDFAKDELKDSDDEVDTSQSKSQLQHVTDESSPDAVESRKNAEKPKIASTVWKIPKKKSSPIKQSLIAIPGSAGGDAQSESPADQAKLASRIPRKKPLIAPDPQPITLLVKETKNTPPPRREEQNRPLNNRDPSARDFPAESGNNVAISGSSPLRPREQPPSARDSSRSENHRPDRNAGNRLTGSQDGNRDRTQSDAFRNEPHGGHFRNRPHLDRPPAEFAGHSPNHRDRRGYDGNPGAVREIMGQQGPGFNSQPSRDRRYRDSADHFRYDRHPTSGYDGGRYSYHDDRADGSSNRRPGFNENYQPVRDGWASRGGYEDSGGHRTDAFAGNYNDRYTPTGYAGDNNGGRYDRRYELSADEWGDDRRGRRWGRDSRDRWEGDSWRHQDYSPDSRGYDRQGGRSTRVKEEYDDYQHSRRSDRAEEDYNGRYDESPRKKHRSHRSRDRSSDRSRDRDKRHRESSRSEHKRRRSSERGDHDHKSSRSYREEGQIEFPGSTNPDAKANSRMDDRDYRGNNSNHNPASPPPRAQTSMHHG